MDSSFDEILFLAVQKHSELLSEITEKINALFGFYCFTMFSTSIISFVSNLYAFTLIHEIWIYYVFTMSFTFFLSMLE